MDQTQPPESRTLLIDRQGLSTVVTARLREMIVDGRFMPGTRLNERVLCEQLLVSRTPLREAFKTLEVEGLINILPNRGAVVAQLSVDDVKQTFEVLAALEGLSGKLACDRITDEELAEIKSIHTKMLAAHARHDLPAYYPLNHSIHDRINAAARNAVLTATYLQINARVQNIRFRSNFDQDKWNLAVKEHCEMLEALEKRDGDRLQAVLQRHLYHKLDSVLANFREMMAPADRA
jgi:DNA-binding GntR family transcriptional regulator